MRSYLTLMQQEYVLKSVQFCFSFTRTFPEPDVSYHFSEQSGEILSLFATIFEDLRVGLRGGFAAGLVRSSKRTVKKLFPLNHFQCPSPTNSSSQPETEPGIL
jgi:hypothetical protein